MQVLYEIIHVQNITIYYVPAFAPKKKKSNTTATPNSKERNVLGLKIMSYGKLNLSKVCYVETKYRIMGKILQSSQAEGQGLFHCYNLTMFLGMT